MSDRQLRLYTVLARWRWPKSYTGKVMLVAVAGALLPLLALLVFLAASRVTTPDAAARLATVALVAALAGGAGTAYALRQLLAPVRLTYQALQTYIADREIVELPADYTDEAGVLMAGTQHTITKLDQVIDHLASYDQLTGLPNRALLRDRVRQALSQTRRDGRPFALLSVDIDGFRALNTTWGPAVGDALLTAVAQRIAASVRENDLLARLDADEFVVLTTTGAAPAGVAAQAQRVLGALARPFTVDGNELRITASIGITVYPSDQGGIDQLLNNAIAAARITRDAGGSGYRFHSAELQAQVERRMTLEGDLRGALARGELRLHYQPKVDLNTRRITGAEALLRWEHPKLGLVSPDDFIPVAEETGLIIPIGEWVVRAACGQVAAWRARGLVAPRVSVNLSPRQFKQESVVAMITTALAETHLDPSVLGVEINEQLVSENAGHAADVLGQLRRAGVSVTLEDFGTDYSSLSHIKNFPLDVVKVEKRFVREFTSDAASGAIVSAVIALAHGMGFRVLAEGVETEAQAAILASRGCDSAQGYLFGRAMPPDALAAMLPGVAGTNG